MSHNFKVRKNGRQKTFNSFGNIAAKRVEQRYRPRKKNLAILFVARQVRTLVPCEQRFLQRPAWRNHCSQGRTLVVKRATSLFSFCRNVVELIRSRHAKLEALDWKRVLFSFSLGTFFLQFVLTFSYFSLTPNPLTFLVVPVVLKGDFQLHY